MHDVLPVGCFSLDNQVTFPIKVFEFLLGSVLPWFVDWLYSKNCRMTTVFVHHDGNHVKSMLDIIIIDGGIRGSFGIKLPNPTSRTNGPTRK